MSIHYDTAPEVQAKLKKQKTTSTIISVFISLSVIALIAVILAALTILIPDATKPESPIEAYRTEIETKIPESEPKLKPQRTNHSVPTGSPNSAMAAFTSATFNPVSIPKIDKPIDTESIEFSADQNFGLQEGFETTLSSETEMFVPISGSRIAYVIDYSLSMKGKRDQLMREELSASIAQLENGADYSLIFFAGPTWQASDQIVMMPDGRSIKTTIQEDGKEVLWNGSKHKIDTKELDKFQPDWIKPTTTNIEKSLQYIQSTPLALGTEWKKPLMKALEMRPQPDTIIFMTDGTNGANSPEVAKEIGKIAKRKSIVINAIALLEPKAQDSMTIMAEATGGSAIMVNSKDDVVDLFTGEQIVR